MSHNNQSTDPNNLIEVQKDVLLGMYCESCTHARHYEDQRATVSNIIMLATVGLIGIIAPGNLTREDWPLTFCIVLLGLFGAVFTTIYFRRINRFERRAEEFLMALDVLLFDWPNKQRNSEPRALREIVDEADKAAPERTYLKDLRKPPKRQAVSLFRMFWPLVIAVIALIATVYARSQHKNPPETYKLSNQSGCLQIVKG